MTAAWIALAVVVGACVVASALVIAAGYRRAGRDQPETHKPRPAPDTTTDFRGESR